MPAFDDQTLLTAMMSLNMALQKRLNARLSFHGLGWTDYRVLQVLAARPEQTMRRIDLAEQVGLTASGVTRLLNPMEKIGLIDKQASDHDARVSLVSWTAAGQRMLKESSVTVADLACQLFGGLDTRQRRELNQALDALASAA